MIKKNAHHVIFIEYNFLYKDDRRPVSKDKNQRKRWMRKENLPFPLVILSCYSFSLLSSQEKLRNKQKLVL